VAETPESEVPSEKGDIPKAETTSQTPTTTESSSAAPSIRPEEEALPDWDEITPELMEDECIRGDVMLKWSAVLVAILLGCTYVTETLSLVQVRSGEYMLSNGILPPATDPFSATTADRTWFNTSWLSDILTAVVHMAAGLTGLSLLNAVLVMIAALTLSRISFPKTTNWWASVCTVFAILAAFPILQPGVATISFVLITLIMWSMFQGSQLNEPSAAKPNWTLVILMVVYGNAGAYPGHVLVLLAIALLIQGLQSMRQGAAIQPTLITAGAGFLGGVVLNPFPLKSLTTMGADYAAASEAQAYGGLSEHFGHYSWGLSEPTFWHQIDLFNMSAMCLLLGSVICLLLNATRARWGLLLFWAGANALSLKFGDWIGFSAAVNAAVAAMNGMQWYQQKWDGTYSIATLNVALSRTGRAVAVLAMFAVAYFAINGALMGRNGRRIGIGLDPRWSNRIESMTTLVDRAYGDNIFPMRPDQGDLLIWIGKKPFVDSRLKLYSSGPKNIAELHQKLRAQVAVNSEEEEWKERFTEYDTFDSIARLWGTRPSYLLFLQQMTNPDWALTGLDSAGALMTRNDLDDEAITKHVKENSATQFVRDTFRSGDVITEEERPPTWPHPETEYESWLVQEMTEVPNDLQLAQHYTQFRQSLGSYLNPPQIVALCYLTIRHAKNGLIEHPNHPLAHSLLSDAYMQLHTIEQQVSFGQQTQASMHFDQGTFALFDTAAASQDPMDQERLFRLVLAQKKLDLAMRLAYEYEEKNGKLIATEGADEDAVEQMKEMLDNLSQHVTTVREQITTAMGQNATLPQLIGLAQQNNCPLEAIKLIEGDLTEVAKNPNLQIEYAGLLMQVGRTEEAWEKLESMAQMLPLDNPPPELNPIISRWRTLTANANLASHTPQRAIELWSEGEDALTMGALKSLIQQPVLSSMIAQQHDMSAAVTGRISATAMLEFPERWATLALHQALAKLEEGQNAAAQLQLEGILEQHPEYTKRTMVILYLNLLTGEPIEILPPSQWIPVWGDDMFAPDEAPEESPSAKKTTKPAKKDQDQEQGKGDEKEASADAEKPTDPPPEKKSAEELTTEDNGGTDEAPAESTTPPPEATDEAPKENESE